MKDEGVRVDFRRRFRLFFIVVAIVALLILAKVAVHLLHFEFLVLDTLFSSVVAGAIFIIGFLLTGILPDYKEAERIPSDIRAALEAIHDDISMFALSTPALDIVRLRTTLVNIVAALERGLGREGAHSHLENAIAEADKLTPIFAQLERLGMSPNFVVRLRGEHDKLRKCLYRISYIQKIEFVPSVHVLIQTLVCAVLFLLLFLRTDGSCGTAIIFGFVSYMFVYALHLINVFEQPYRQGDHSADDVSLFLLRDFVTKLEREQASGEAPVPAPVSMMTAKR
jgi:hypothetical protein